MSFHTDAKHIAFTRRCLTADSVVEVVYTPRSVSNTMYLLDGRVQTADGLSTQAWDSAMQRGYFLFERNTGRIDTIYSATKSTIRLDTNEEVTSIEAGVTYKTTMSNFTSTHEYITYLGCRFKSSTDVVNYEEFDGKIHYIKATNTVCGYNIPSDAGKNGIPADIHLQFDRIKNREDVPENPIYMDCLNPVAEQIVGPAVAGNSTGWLYEESTDTWTRNPEQPTWGNRLFLMGHAVNDTNGQKVYPRLLRVKFDAHIPDGKNMILIYKLPDRSSKSYYVKHGHNDVVINVEGSGNHDVERPYFDSAPEGGGVTISGLKTTEYHGAIFNGVKWTKTDV